LTVPPNLRYVPCGQLAAKLPRDFALGKGFRSMRQPETS
jgi:hypothetical protein